MPITDVTTDPEALTLTITGEYPVPVERLWNAWADPRQLERFWGPPTWPATFTRHDMVEGGRSEYFMTGPDGTKSNYASNWVNAITTKAEGEKYDAAVKFMEYITSDEAMQIWLDTVGELPAKPSAAMTEANKSDPVFGPFIEGLSYAKTTVFADESAQRQVLVDAVSRMQLEGQSAAESLAKAAEEEQAILDSYYK